MKRRQFLRIGAAAVATGAVAKPAVSQAAPQLKWRLASSYGKSLDVMNGAVQSLCRFVAETTDNNFVIQPHLAGELAPSNQALDAVASGSVECAFTPTGYYQGKEPVLAFGSGVPFGLNARQQSAWWTFGGGREHINNALKRLNVIGFPAGASGTQMGAWFRKEIVSLEDLKGLRVRMMGLGGPVLARVGAIPYQMAFADVYPSLENGTLDAADFFCPYDDEKIGFVKVAPINHYPCWWEGSGTVHLIVNIETWDALPKAYKAALMRACDASLAWMLTRYDYVNPGALRRLLAAGAVLKPFPQPVLEACYKAAADLLAETSARNVPFKKALESMSAFRSEHLAWRQVAEQSFDSFMIGTRKS